MLKVLAYNFPCIDSIELSGAVITDLSKSLGVRQRQMFDARL